MGKKRSTAPLPEPGGPFAALGKLVTQRGRQRSAAAPPSPAAHAAAPNSTTADDDDAIFRQAMVDVTPLRGPRRCSGPARPAATPPRACDPEAQAVRQLAELVESGRGFWVPQHPEFIAGAASDMPAAIIGRLHKGEFAIQAHIDLHGLTAVQAEQELAAFLQRALRQGLRTVLVIHGRGLSSPDGPVLKTRFEQWITRGMWRCWVAAYASARPADGGTGATVILLRRWRCAKRRGLRS